MVALELDIPMSFYEEEERNGYKITRQTKEIWAVELDLLYKLMSVCDKHGIKYMASYGTLLGAVRHKGMIPWDDDIDVMMPRNDYNKLCEIALNEFTYPYFFQTEASDPGYLLRHAKLRNSETTALQKCIAGKNYRVNQGMFIDVFPIDNLPDDAREEAIFMQTLWEKWGRLWKLSAYKNRKMRFSFYENVSLAVENTLMNILKKDYSKDFEKYLGKYKDAKTDVCCIVNFYLTPKGISKKSSWTTDWLEETVTVPFEMFDLPIPKHYDKVLRQTYGDYQTFVVGGGSHGEVFFDVNKSYIEYL